jgi:ribonuclease P protein component
MDRLRQRADFLAVANGARANSTAFVLQGRHRGDDGPIRFGFTVTKKNGTATERNRIRRRLRELVKLSDAISMRPHHDYVLVGRRAALHRDFSTMLDDLRAALHRLDRQTARPGTGSRSNQVYAGRVDPSAVENASKQQDGASVLASISTGSAPTPDLNDETPKR